VRVLDCTWFMPGAPQTGKQAYDVHHIPGARHLDIDDVADTTIPLPHMLPPPEKFSSRVRRLGLGDGHRIICYDQNGFLASARTWWMFRAMGHADVAVLDGGFNAWRDAGGAVEDLPPHFMADRHFTVRPRRDLVRNLEQMKETVGGSSAQVVDARSGARFRGEVDEPRPGLRKGHMPGAFNVYYADLIAASISRSPLSTHAALASPPPSSPSRNPCSVTTMQPSMTGHGPSGPSPTAAARSRQAEQWARQASREGHAASERASPTPHATANSRWVA
jgi:thiosulfate/3-mercaptopyruvate sulfurtransferase